MSDDPDLTFVPTEVLFDAIRKRFDGCLLVWTRDDGGEHDAETRHIMYQGWSRCLGWSVWAQKQLLDHREFESES